MTERLGGWMTTFTGLRFCPSDPRPEEIVIEDIAHALSHLCRFAGHVRRFYSVASHSLAVAEVVGRTHPELRLAALLHDATEAYLVDLPRPVKMALNTRTRDPAPVPFGASEDVRSYTVNPYKELEHRVWLAIAERFGLPKELPSVVKDADTIMLVTEARELLNTDVNDWVQSFNMDPLDAADQVLRHVRGHIRVADGAYSQLPVRPEHVKTEFLEAFARYAYPAPRKAGSA